MFMQVYSHRVNRRYKGAMRTGFTLIELLLVMVILVVLAFIALPRITGTAERAREDACSVEIQTLTTSVNRFELDMGRFPRSEEGLDALFHDPGDVTNADGTSRWRGPYIEGMKNVPKDKWNHDYVFRSPGTHNPNSVDISSGGSKAVEGAINNWSR